MTNTERLEKLFARLDEVEAYVRAIGKVSFDMECCAPEEGIEQAGKDMALVGQQIFKLTHSKKYQRLISELHENSDGLSPLQKKAVEHLYDDYSKVKNQTAKFSYEMDMVASKAYGDWLSAKKNNDFSQAPFLFRWSVLSRCLRYVYVYLIHSFHFVYP